MKYRWAIAPSQPDLSSQLAHGLNISSLLAQCLINRGLTEPETISRFLEPRLKHLADPFLLPNMEAAVTRLLQARDQHEAVLVFGDYDVDGVTSTAILTEVFIALGWRANYYLPCRFDEGYGLTREAVENCLVKFPTTLILAVDCGSTSVETIAWLRERGIDVVVLDHHQISTPPPEAVALVNPRFKKTENAPSTNVFHELCSAGLAFKLAHALVKRLRESNDETAVDYDLRPLLDLVALGTIADIVPLIGENRILVTMGLDWLQKTQRPGLVALKTVARTEDKIGVHEVGFQLAPRLNAAGRLESAEEALRLVLAKTLTEATPLATAVDTRNRERQAIERGIADEVAATVREKFKPEEDFVIVEGKLPWHIGVVGIVASRVLQEFYRPTIIVGGDGEYWRGSGRSVEGFDLAAALRECSDLLVRHGGHAMAAGVTIQPEKIDSFRQRLNEIARRILKPELLKPSLRLDAEIRLSDLPLQRLEELQALKPGGPGNPAVNLVIRNLSHQRPPQRMGKENQHAKFWVTDGSRVVEAVWWNCAGADLPKVHFHLAFTPEINEFNGRRNVQLKVLDWCSAAS